MTPLSTEKIEALIHGSGEGAALLEWRAQLRAEGRKLVMTNGCFDLLHAGHVRYLAQARALGDALLVALNDDESVRGLKGPARPVNPAGDRREVIEALRSIDRVAVFRGDRVTELVAALQPDIYAKGGDYTVDSLHPGERAALEACAAEIHILPMVEGRSTSATLARLREDTPRRLRLGVLGSGSGTNLQAIFDAIDRGDLDAEVNLVLSDVADAGILRRAEKRGVPAVWVDPGPYRTKLGEAARKEMRDRLRAADVDLVLLAGFMRLVRGPLLESFSGRMLNIHPSLLPDFPGLEAWCQALKAGVSETGCTVHLVDDGMDTGPIVLQQRVPVVDGDTPATLHARIQEAEHRIYPLAVAKVAQELGLIPDADGGGSSNAGTPTPKAESP